MLDFKCINCNTVFQQSWFNISRIRNNSNRNGLVCPKCGGKTESIHALVLKQVFMHEHSDTNIEDKSCINPNTNKIMPTDIVNHNLKIAIEIQSQWHDFEDQKAKDKIKKNYWLNRGYKFYAPDIRNYTILQMIQLFFPNIDKIPEYINFDYSNKINIVKIQEMLNKGVFIGDISKELNINIHRIYDAIYSNKLFYPDGYKSNKNGICVVQLDIQGNYIATYSTVAEACRYNNLKSSSIVKCLRNNTYYSQGYYWVKYDDYQKQNYILKTRLKLTS